MSTRAAGRATIASDLEKYGFDDVVLYRDDNGQQFSKTELIQRIGEACPSGIDVYYDNVGGEIYDATLPNFNNNGRIVVVGRVSAAELSDTSKDIGPRDNSFILVKRLQKMGFLVFDYYPQSETGLSELSTWLKEGKIKHREDVLDGIENAPEAFIRMMNGQNMGKQLVRIDPSRNE